MTKDSAKKRIIAELNKPHWSIDNIEWILNKLETEYCAPPKGDLIEYAAEACGTTPESVSGRNHLGRLSRKREAVMARHLIYKELINQGKTLDSAGKTFGQDHTTVLHALKQVNDGLDVNWKPMREAYDKFQNLINGKDIHTLHNEEERSESL
jgi:chromosomal replication initiation ATPase DnaA